MDEVVCSKCGQAAQFKCERCLEPYCSSQCQVNDWQDHKSKCYKFPNLVPINMLKSVSSNMHLDRTGGSQRRPYGSAHNLNETRRSSNPVNCNKPKPKNLLNDEDFTMVPKAAPTAASTVSVVKPLSAKPCTWRVPFPPPEGFFEAMIQFKEEVEIDKRIVWVTDIKYDSSLRKLLAEINRSINHKCPCNPEDIYEGALVAAPLDKMFYRAEILETSPEVQKATVRLIDYGNELRVPYSQLFAPIPIMCNLNAYALRVCLPNDYGPLEIESIVTIKVVGDKNPENYYNVECKLKSIPLHLPIELLNKEPALKVVKCFSDGRNALLRLCNVGGVDDQEFDSLLNSPQSISFEFDTLPKVGAFVAVRTQFGWKRARLLGFCEKLHQYLVYTIDEGVITLSTQIKRVPDAFVSQPIRVFAISTNSTDCMLSEAMLTTAKGLTLELLPTTSSTVNTDSKTQLPCGLFDEKRKIMDVVIASVFTGSLSELGLKLWNERIPEGGTVIISHVLTYKEVYVASQQNCEYSKILMSEYSNCVPFATNDTIEKNDIVIWCQNEEDKSSLYCRGQIIGSEGNELRVMNIDSGCEQIIAHRYLRKPTQLVCSLPVRCYRVILMFLESIPTPVANNKALEALETCMQNAVEFDITYSDKNTVDLLFRTKEKQSLCKKLLPMVFEPATTQTPIAAISAVPENTSFPLSPPNTPLACKPPNTATMQIQATQVPEALACAATIKQNEVFTMDHLDVIPIVCGEKVPLYVLDPTTILNLESPYITASDYNNKEFLAKMEQYLQKVAEYCKSDKAPKNGYAPKKMEICLCVFADDGEWYRAMCVDHKPNDTYVVMFLDYGNMSKVNKKDIMPMISDLMFPSNANTVYVEGITTKEQGMAFIKSIQINPIVYAKVDRIHGVDAYMAMLCT
ncbi:tudor domain-containing protein 1 [Calliphora vicina]|uniref:tudor domain-containing protein 1 n=1 Tax=Calliphora vicina TaxID=7373 RepID=UPI00325A7AAA